MSEPLDGTNDRTAEDRPEDIAVDTGEQSPESITMSPQEERDASEQSSLEMEPPDEGVGAMTDNEGEPPATEN
ncbi:hypothetical protein GWK18_07455 [Kocuria sp. JC486]|uniref:hypothetical protein n=1 Tax=Kocuria sp. JC486 TaxID=1970736 RepID=UPI00142374C3|nr:hypothetical protein [Kocuria sp. JC486]NHU85428.1 hypothetical protein [Kocuria sp. JC486]